MEEYFTEVYREMSVLSGSDVIIYCLKSFFEGTFGVFVFGYDYAGWIGLIVSFILVAVALNLLPDNTSCNGLFLVLLGCILTQHYIVAALYVISYILDFISSRKQA